MLLGSLVNGAAILAGSAVGLFLRFILRRSSRRNESENGIGDRLQKIVMQGLALCTMYIGISGSLKGQNTLLAILSLVIGAVIGEILDLDGAMNRAGNWVQKKVTHPGEEGAASTVAGDHERRARLCRIIPPREPQPVGRGDVHALARQRVERVDGAGYLFPVDLHLRVFRYVMVVVLRAAGRIKCVAVQPIQSAERGKRRSGRGAERLFPLDHNQPFFPAHYTINRPQYN